MTTTLPNRLKVAFYTCIVQYWLFDKWIFCKNYTKNSGKILKFHVFIQCLMGTLKVLIGPYMGVVTNSTIVLLWLNLYKECKLPRIDLSSTMCIIIVFPYHISNNFIAFNSYPLYQAHPLHSWPVHHSAPIYLPPPQSLTSCQNQPHSHLDEQQRET